MKMVLVYDTENVEDLQNSIAIMRKLVSDYDQRHGYGGDKRRFGRIQFIKTLRQWEREAKNEPRSPSNPDIATLRSVKLFTDEIWKNHEER
tara:strand:+ start:148 stop:420 length:273 start_codon:yes stop_codon:yes gene_type:complete